MVRCVVLSPDDRTLVTGSHDQTLRVWLAATGQLLHIVPGASATSQFSVAFDADGQLLAHTSVENTVNLIHPPSGHIMECLSVAQERPLVVAHSTEGHLLACGTHEGTVWVWDVERGALRRPGSTALPGAAGAEDGLATPVQLGREVAGGVRRG